MNSKHYVGVVVKKYVGLIHNPGSNPIACIFGQINDSKFMA